MSLPQFIFQAGAVRSAIAVVVLIAGSSLGRAQVTTPMTEATTAPAYQVEEDGEGRGELFGSLQKKLSDTPGQLLLPQFGPHERERSLAAATIWGKEIEARENLALRKADFPFFYKINWRPADGLEAAQATSNDSKTILRQIGETLKVEERSESLRTRYRASSYVPLDSWVYAAMDRLAAMGYQETDSTTIRPWTRLECARLLAEAHTNVDGDLDDTTAALLKALDLEFAHETDVIDGNTGNTGAQVESVYERFRGIAGTPLRDGYHFGQTLTDDYGRPYGKGANSITGVSGRAEVGPLAFYVRSEYQYAAAMPAYSTAAQQAIASDDGLPFGWNLRFGTTRRVHPVEAYAALNLANWQISFGQQSLWWGPDRTTSLILSNNADAMPMLRIARVKPARLGWLGPVHLDAFFSRQGGVHYVRLGRGFTLYGSPSQPLTPPPYLWGFTVSIKPTVNLELGFAHTTIFAGYGRPLNLKTFFHTFSVDGNDQELEPGKRVTEFNFSYHLPWLRRSVVLYNEAMAWDAPVQGKFVARYAMSPGVYIPRVPGFNKLDLRMEGVYTNLPKLTYQSYFYANAHYAQGYTNYGQIMGSWVGRQGSGGEASSTYWFSARNKATLSYRKMVADKTYLQGGNITDLSGDVSWLVRPDVEVLAKGQYERWNFPLLGAGAKSNFTTSFEVRFFPKTRVSR